MDRNDELLLRVALAAVAPGTELRDSLERILRGRTGALIVLGHDKVVESICTGGFTLDGLVRLRVRVRGARTET